MGEADRAKYRGRKCPECGLPMAACNEITELKMDVRKLRAALEEIAKGYTEATKIAKAALANEQLMEDKQP
jgi:hypothetical protein